MDQKIAVDKNNGDVYNIFMDVCFSSTNIRTIATSCAPIGNLRLPFKTFKFNFDILYTITCDNKELIKNDKQLLADILKWLSRTKKQPEKKYMLYGIDLFYKYKEKLISYKVVYIGAQ